jgi:hypothetical protein
LRRPFASPHHRHGRDRAARSPVSEEMAPVETIIGIALIIIAAVEIVGIIRVVTANQPG